jgi:hypothetical protein
MSRRRYFVFLISLILFGLIQYFFLNNLRLFDLNSYNYANRFDFGGTVDGINNVTPTPNVIFLGTSLLRYSLYALNETLSQSTSAPTATSTVDPHVCQLAKGSLSRNYSFAIAGILVSDLNMIFRKYMNCDITGGTVYVECSPRAFYDSGIQPTATPAFKYFCDWRDVLSPRKALTNQTDRLQWLTNILIPMYRFRHDIQENLVHFVTVAWKEVNQDLQLATNTTSQHGGEVSDAPIKYPTVLAKSLAEYAGRYAGISGEKCAVQLTQLQDLVGQVKAKKARPVLMVMLLTQANVDLLPPGFYTDWKNSLKRIALAEHCTFLDLSEYKFENSDFQDSVHLNNTGSTKLLSILEARTI